MMSKKMLNSRHASILIMVLWALTLLTVFAIQIGLMTRNKISFLARIERQSLLRHAARGGIAKGLAMIKNDFVKNSQRNLLQTQLSLLFNPSAFHALDFGQAEVDIVHDSNLGKDTYGITDEESRLNINFADRGNIQKLLLLTGAVKEEEADKIATAIYDWRVYGESEIEGFSSDEFYDNLEFAYPQKKANFETLDELRLVEGVSERVYDSIIDYITVYGNKAINVNTVSWQVLSALGLTEEQAKLAITLRRGADGIEGTLDDSLFDDPEVWSNQLIRLLELPEEDLKKFQEVLSKIPMTSSSQFFRIHSIARLTSRDENKSITCVFDINDDKIIYWREQ